MYKKKGHAQLLTRITHITVRERVINNNVLGTEVKMTSLLKG